MQVRVWLLERREGPESTMMTDDPIIACLPIACLMSLFGRSIVNSSYAGFGVFEEVHRMLLGRVEDLQSVVQVRCRCE